MKRVLWTIGTIAALVMGAVEIAACGGAIDAHDTSATTPDGGEAADAADASSGVDDATAPIDARDGNTTAADARADVDARTDADAASLCVYAHAHAPDAAAPDAGAIAPWADNPNGKIVAVTRDRAGNLIVTGTSGVDTSFYLAKFDPLGRPIWSKVLGTLYVFGNDVATDAAGNIIVAGSTGGGPVIDFGGGPLPPGGFLVRFTPSGDFLDQKVLAASSAHSASPTQVRVLPSGDYVVAGGFSGAVNLGGGTISTPARASIFVVRYDPCWRVVFTKAFIGAGHQALLGLEIDPWGNIYLSGAISGDVDFGAGPLTGPATGWTIVAAKLDATGNHLASRKFAGAGDQTWPGRLGLDGAGNVLLTGRFDSTIDFGGGPLVSAGAEDVYVAKLGPMLETVWAKRFGGPARQSGLAVTADAAGNALVAGVTEGDMVIGAQTLHSPSAGSRIFVGRFDAVTGAPLAAELASGVSNTATSVAYSILAADGENVVLGGAYYGTFTLGPASFTVPEYGGVGLLMRYAP